MDCGALCEHEMLTTKMTTWAPWHEKEKQGGGHRPSDPTHLRIAQRDYPYFTNGSLRHKGMKSLPRVPTQ